MFLFEKKAQEHRRNSNNNNSSSNQHQQRPTANNSTTCCFLSDKACNYIGVCTHGGLTGASLLFVFIALFTPVFVITNTDPITGRKTTVTTTLWRTCFSTKENNSGGAAVATFAPPPPAVSTASPVTTNVTSSPPTTTTPAPTTSTTTTSSNNQEQCTSINSDNEPCSSRLSHFNAARVLIFFAGAPFFANGICTFFFLCRACVSQWWVLGFIAAGGAFLEFIAAIVVTTIYTTAFCDGPSASDVQGSSVGGSILCMWFAWMIGCGSMFTSFWCRNFQKMVEEETAVKNNSMYPPQSL